MTSQKRASREKFRDFVCSVCGCECRIGDAASSGHRLCPCPGCGWVPREPIEVRRARLHFVVTSASGLVFAGLIVAGLVGLGVPTWCLLAGITGLACLLAQGAIALWDPNRDLEKNFAGAEGLVAQGLIRDVRRPARTPTRPVDPTHGLGWTRTGLLAVAALSVGAMVSAEVVRRHQGWIFNSELGVLGPGDSFTVNFQNNTHSIGGRWSGEPLDPQIVLTEERAVAIQGLTSATHTHKWGEEIASSTSEKPFAPWSTVTLPARDELSWRRMKLKVRLDALFPDHRGDDVFIDATKKFRKTLDVTLSAPGAGQSYAQLWRFGGLGGAIAFLLANLALATDRTSSMG